MKYKYLIICLVILNNNSVLAQNQKIYGEIIYEQSENHINVGVANYILYFNKNKSYYQELLNEKFVKKIKNNTVEKEDGSTQKNNYVISKNNNLKFYYNTKTGFYFRENYLEKTFLVKENEFEWKWKLHSDTKRLGKFNCQKATAKFRGRKYTAWFTNEVPVPFGPWKFNNISGLILEVYEDDYKIHIIAKSIKINNENTDINIEVNHSKLLSLKEFVKKKEKLRNEYLIMLSSKLPKGSKPYKANCEDCLKPLEIFDEEN